MQVSPLWQSPLELQCFPGPQPGQMPPQSTSTSCPFFLPSLQEAAAVCAVHREREGRLKDLVVERHGLWALTQCEAASSRPTERCRPATRAPAYAGLAMPRGTHHACRALALLGLPALQGQPGQQGSACLAAQSAVCLWKLFMCAFHLARASSHAC